MSSLLFAETGGNFKNLPPGVDPGKWIPIKENFGFVVTRIEPSKTEIVPKEQGKDKEPLDRLKKEIRESEKRVVEGYFLLRVGDTWCKVKQEFPEAKPFLLQQ